MNVRMKEDIFYRILAKTAGTVEMEEFFKSLESDDEKREEFLKFKNLYVVSSFDADGRSMQKNESFKKFWDKVHPHKSRRLVLQWMKYAAIFLIASVMGFAVHTIISSKDYKLFSQHIEYSSEKGSVSKIYLEDGSAIWLSSGTKLILDQYQNGKSTAQLDGEAFFDLIPNPQRNFTVDLGHFKIKDIGTKFNVRSYQSESSIMTSLVDGQINMLSKNETHFLTMKPGEFVSYNKSNKDISVTTQDPSIVTAWKDGKFVFIDKTLAEICKELENWYNVQINIDDKELANTRYTSIVKRTTSVKMVLQILAVTDKINYQITDKEEGNDIISIRK